MTRISRVLLLPVLLVFALACNFVTQPFNQAQEAVETVQSLATALPIETIQSFATALPLATIEALPSAMPDMPDFGNMADPKDPPLKEWNGIPIIPSATAGNDSTGIYSFKAAATTDEVFDYYKAEMTRLGWSEFFSMPDTGSGAIITYEKENNLVTITVTESGNGVLVYLMYQ